MPKKKFLWLFAACCLVPLAMAQLVLSAGWFSAGANSKGQWLSEEITLLPATAADQPHWRLVYLAPTDCQQQCQQTLNLMTQIYTALGRKQDNLTLVVLGDVAPKELATTMQFKQGKSSVLAEGQLILVEHNGLALLQYQFPADASQLPLLGKAVMSDLKKLISYDRGPV
jgi:hypothetical protein